MGQKMNYKNKLYSIVQNYLGEEGDLLYDTFEDIMDLNNYESTLTKGYDKLIKDLSKADIQKINKNLDIKGISVQRVNNLTGQVLKGK